MGILGTSLNAVTRIPVIFAGMNASLFFGEEVLRIFGIGLSFIGFTGEGKIASAVSSHLPDVTINVMRPFKQLSDRQVIISFLVCTVISTLGWELCNKCLKEAPETYNQFNKWVSPIRLDTKWRHPIIAMAVKWYNSSSKDLKKDT